MHADLDDRAQDKTVFLYCGAGKRERNKMFNVAVKSVKLVIWILDGLRREHRETASKRDIWDNPDRVSRFLLR